MFYAPSSARSFKDGTPAHLLSLAKDVKQGFYTVPTGNRTRRVAVHTLPLRHDSSTINIYIHTCIYDIRIYIYKHKHTYKRKHTYINTHLITDFFMNRSINRDKSGSRISFYGKRLVRRDSSL